MSTDQISDLLRPLDVQALSEHFREAHPTRYFVVDNFLREDFAREVRAAYPSYEEARQRGHQFKAVNENLKIQITDPGKFPEPVRLLSDALASEPFLKTMEEITGIPRLCNDEEHSGGGMHVMGSGGRLDVHVDFNLIRARGLYRRLNILVFMNEGWQDRWGGQFELWDPEVKQCVFQAAPIANRCVVFNTTESSFHGVLPLKTPKGVTRNSYAAYYYTREAPAEGTPEFHSTVFRPRPSEWWRQALLVPAERSARALRGKLDGLRRRLGAQHDDPAA